MKITDKRTKRKPTTFKDLKCGDIFEYLDGIYLRLDPSDRSCNVFNLKENVYGTFSDEIVTPLEAELMIRGQKEYD